MKQTFTQLIALIGLLAYLLIGSSAFAQAPQKFNYQGIARDAKGNPMAKQQLNLKISVLPTADATVAEYEETQLVSTNEFGLYTLQIGGGAVITGDMKTVKWETGNKYISVAIDPTGGTNFVNMGTTQLLSVPYAIYADKAGMANESATTKETRTGAVSSNAAHVVGDANYVTKFTALNTIGKSLIFDNGARVGIGTATPLSSGLLHLQSVIGTQPLILESPQGVHNLIREAGVNRGYFGSYIGSGGAYPTPAGTSDADFDIGTSGASTGKLHFATNTTPRVTIMPTTGNMGVGTTTPTTKLEVAGQVKITGGTPGLNKVLTSDATGLATWQTITTGILSQWQANGNTINSTNTGNVGIGNVLPIYKLHISDSVGKYALIENPSNLAIQHKTGLLFKSGNSYTGAIKTIGISSSASRMAFYRASAATTNESALQECMTISTSGYVGINDTTPSYTLDVNGSIRATSNLYADGAVYNTYQQNYGDSYVDGYFDVDGYADFASNIHVGGTTTNDGNLTVGGTASIGGEMTVSNGNGIVKSNSGTQLRMGFAGGGVASTVAAGGSVSATFGVTAFAGNNANIRVSVAQFQPNSGSGTGFTHFIMTPHSVNATNNSVEVTFFNAGSTSASFDGTLYLLCVATD